MTIFVRANPVRWWLPTRLPKAADRPRIVRTGSCGPVISSTTTNGSASVPEPAALTTVKPPSSSLKVMPDDDNGAAAAPPLWAATASIQTSSETLTHACILRPLFAHGGGTVKPRCPSGLILTLGSQASGSDHQINRLVVRFTQRMGTIRCDRTTRPTAGDRGPRSTSAGLAG